MTNGRNGNVVQMLKADRTLSQEEYLIYRRSLYTMIVVSICVLSMLWFSFLCVSTFYFISFDVVLFESNTVVRAKQCTKHLSWRSFI